MVGVVELVGSVSLGSTLIIERVMIDPVAGKEARRRSFGPRRNLRNYCHLPWRQREQRVRTGTVRA